MNNVKILNTGGEIFVRWKCSCDYDNSTVLFDPRNEDHLSECMACGKKVFINITPTIVTHEHLVSNMPTFLHYLEYTGTVSFDSNDGCFFGKLQVNNADCLFEGETIRDLFQDFRLTIENYLDDKEIEEPKNETIYEWKWYLIIDDVKYYSEDYLTAWEAHDPALIFDDTTKRIRESGIKNKFEKPLRKGGGWRGDF